MDIPFVLQMVTLFFGGGGILMGILAWRKDARLGPVEVEAAKVANATVVAEQATEWVRYQDEKLKLQDERIQIQDDRIAAISDELQSLRMNLQGWGYWYMDLAANWPKHRARERPPKAPKQGMMLPAEGGEVDGMETPTG